MLALKRERKSSVMMAVMFLIISAVIASPFALGMVSVYSQFMQSFGKQTQLISVAPFAGQIYLVIHSVLVGLIVSIIMYGNVKKGIKFFHTFSSAFLWDILSDFQFCRSYVF